MASRNKKKRKKRNQQKKNRILFLGLILLIVITYIIVQKREDETYAVDNKEISIEPIKEIIEDKQAKVSRYTVYGTHMNIEGTLEVNNSEIEDVNIIARNISEEELIIDTTYEYENNSILFSTLNKINQGVDLENLSLENYYILLKVNYTNGEKKYYTLSNNTQYHEKISYYTLTRNNTNNRINIDFIKDEGIEALTLEIDKINELPEDVYDIVIDPGHGGSDAGAMSGNYREDEIVLDIGLDLKKKLENLGLKVLITRDGSEDSTYDIYNIYDKEGRVTLANESKAKVLISLHMNSNESDLVHGGVEVYAAPNMNYTLAKLFADNIVKNANTTYSKMESFKEETGVYVRNIEVENRNYGTFNGYRGIYDEVPYLFIIREIGGISTGAYVNGSNKNYGENIYRNSNVGVEGYLIELGYMNVNADLRNVLNNPGKYVQAIMDSINSYYKIR